MTQSEHEILEFIITNFSNILVATVGFFLVRTMNRVDKTLEKLAEKVDNHEGRISFLEGKSLHDIRKGLGG